MDGNGFKRVRMVGLFGSVIIAVLFLSSSAQGLEVTTEDGRTEYEQGEFVIFRISGLNNSTVYLNFVHIVTTKIGNNTTYAKDWYGLSPITLNETGNGTLFHVLDYRLEYGNQEATYGYWDLEVFESVNETTIEFLSYRFEVEVNLELLLREWDEKDREKEEKDKAFIAGLDARDNFKNWVIVALTFLFIMTVATHHLGENPVLIFLRRFGILIGKALRTAEQGEVDAVSTSDGATLNEAKMRGQEDYEKLARDHKRKAHKARKKIQRIDVSARKRIGKIKHTAKARKELLQNRIDEETALTTAMKENATSLSTPEQRKVRATFKGGK